jgi:uncharacterized protein (DUF2147 family)
MRAFRRACLLAQAVVFILALGALAAAAAQDPLVGQWRYANGAIMEFSADGVLTIRPPNGGAVNKMRYFVEDDSTLVMLQEDDQTMTTGFKVSANGKRLTLDSMEEGKGRPQEFLERIK